MKFDVEKVTEEIIEFIRDYYRNNHLKGAVVGISGGKDSGVVAALLTKALGCENVLGLWMPCHSNNNDLKDAQELADYLGIELKHFDLTNLYDEFVGQIRKENMVTSDILVDANINIKPRLRMTTLYYYAAMMSKIKNGGYLVIGTSNKSEIYVGYFTKGGDSVCDLRPIADLYVDEVIQIGDYLNVPKCVNHKTPSDGISGKSDEDNLGITYEDIKKVIQEEEMGAKNDLSDDIRNTVIDKHKKNQHKCVIPTYRRKKCD